MQTFNAQIWNDWLWVRPGRPEWKLAKIQDIARRDQVIMIRGYGANVTVRLSAKCDL